MKVISFDEEKILFDNGTKIEFFHDQDCCETVYADFKQLKDTGIKNAEFGDVQIEGVKGSGFRLNGYFIPCYNEQNDYYSSDLTLVITSPDGKKKEIDITDFVEDRID